MTAADQPVAGRIEARELTRTFRRNGVMLQALAGASVTVEPGSLTALLGPSGCGKTTLLRCIAGFDVPDSGEVLVSGRRLVGPGVFVKPEHRRVGIVPQDGALFAHLNVAENVGFGVARSGRARRVAECLELVELGEYAEARPAELSGGQQQRVAVARALAPRPDVLLLDEPFSALDAGLRARVRADIAGLLRSAGISSLLVTHDQDEALSMADTVAVMFDGAVHQFGSPGELYRRPRSLRIARFLGEINELPGDASGAVVATALGTLPLDAAAGMSHIGTVTVAVRPEQLRVRLTGELTATVERVAYYGHDGTIDLVLADGTRLSARSTSSLLPEAGSLVGLDVAGPVLAYSPV
jgi:iron(III) transport system ATP-binding protein